MLRHDDLHQSAMKYYSHRFDTIEQYLHHRPPYLLVDQIESIAETEIVTVKTVSGDEYFLAGHFPEAAVFPGAMLQELTTQSAGILIAANFNPMPDYRTADPHFNAYALGVLVRVHHARYKFFARPGDRLIVHTRLSEHLDNLFNFESSVFNGGRKIMRNSFQLANIPSDVLQGR